VPWSTIRDNAINDSTLTLSSPGASGSLGANKAIVIDTTAPTVDSVSSSTADGDYFPGDNITITVGFNETVYVDNSSGNPRIQLAARSDNNSYANYISGNSTSILSLLYTVQAGDNFSDLDYKATDSLSANNGTIRDNASNDVNLTLASPGATNFLASNKALVFGGYKQEAYVKSINRPNTNMQFGQSVDISGDTMAVGADFEKSNQKTITNGPTASSNDTGYIGAVYVYTRVNTSPAGTYAWSQQAYIKPSNGIGNFERFGFDISLENNTLAVGIEGDASNQSSITNSTANASTNTSYSASGAVFVYTRSGTDWSQQAYIKASNNVANNYFGKFVALSGDTIVTAASNSSVYVYTRSGTEWSEEAIISNSNFSGAQGGFEVDIDNNTIVVSQVGDDSNQSTITNGTGSSSNTSKTNSGAVHVYTRSGTDWTQQAYIKASNSDANDNFGSSISIDGDTLAVSALNEASDENNVWMATSSSGDNSAARAGAVYIYTRSGTDWTQQAYIKPSNAVANGGFGTSVSLQGDLLVVGANEDSNSTSIVNGSTASSDTSMEDSGAVYVFKLSDVVVDDPENFGSTMIVKRWSQIAYIKAVNNRAGVMEFGQRTALDNATIIVGTPMENSDQQGITNGSSASTDTSGGGSAGAAWIYHFY
jgi:hypothetical protein